ncbi:MAG: SufB/SufD family protein [Candidatus Helarchaeota archaeon]
MAKKWKKISSLTDLPHKVLEAAYKSGVVTEGEKRSGSFLHLDQSTVFSEVENVFDNKIELMDIKDALNKFEWLKDYYWKLVDPEKDEFTKKVAEDYSGGYFMRILPNAKITFPLQSCLLITEPGLEQHVHNVIIAEEGSEVHIITGCTMHEDINKAAHLGISEIYVKKNAYLNFSMIHHWAQDTFVRPRTAVTIEENSTFVSNYLSLKPVKDVQMYPVAVCEGDNSTAIFNTLLFADENSKLDVGSKSILKGKGSKTEMVSRSLSKGGSLIIARGYIEGANENCKGHLECGGLLMGDGSKIHAIPELVAKTEGADLSHEAAIGRVAEKEIAYLMTRGLSEEQATSLIIKGFLDIGIMGLPQELDKELRNIMETIKFSDAI